MTNNFYTVQLKWTSEPNDIDIGVGKSAYIPCKAIGSPEPTIEWYRVGEKSESLGSELRFTSVIQQDAGYYECRARNGQDEDLVARIKIGVLGEYQKFLGQSSGKIKLQMFGARTRKFLHH